ncbi:MAG: hypothetical protein JNK64_10290 [Myxococcales bacterium]|nr:hypothetical protein [Myxococcales bacterium]
MRLVAVVLGALAPGLVGCPRAASPAATPAPPVVEPAGPDAAVSVGVAQPPFEVLGRRYQLWEAPGAAWEAAAQACEASGAALAQLATTAELEAVGAEVRTAIDLDAVWIGGGACADATDDPERLCWSSGAPVDIPYRGPYWVRNGRGEPRTHLFLRDGYQLTANADMLPPDGADGFLCAWPAAASR